MIYIVLVSGLGGALLAWFWYEKRLRVTRVMAGGIHRDICLPHQQEFELYHNDLSLCSKKVRVCLAELGLPYRPHHIQLIETGSYETISRHFLKVNPAGILPVLVHNGHPIYESHDIISYVAAYSTDPGKQLVPTDPEDKVLMQHWKDLASIIGDDPTADLAASAAGCVSVLTLPLFAAGIQVIPVHRILEGVLFHRVRARAFLFLLLKVVGLGRIVKIKALATRLDQAKTGLRMHLQALDDLLADDRPWITGQQFTLADISWMVLFDRLIEADWYDYFLGSEEFPQVQAYWQRLRARPSYLEGVDGFRHPLVAQATKRIRQRKSADPRFRAAMAHGSSVVAGDG